MQLLETGEHHAARTMLSKTNGSTIQWKVKERLTRDPKLHTAGLCTALRVRYTPIRKHVKHTELHLRRQRTKTSHDFPNCNHSFCKTQNHCFPNSCRKPESWHQRPQFKKHQSLGTVPNDTQDKKAPDIKFLSYFSNLCQTMFYSLSTQSINFTLNIHYILFYFNLFF